MSAKILKYSIAPSGIKLVTFELEYPRFILAELNTHCMLSKNTASSRAIPINKIIDLITENPVMPIFWGKNKPGMSADEEISPDKIEQAKQVWLELRDQAIDAARKFEELGLHKQIANRVLEPWVTVKTVVTGTELANLFWLRCHSAAQPEFRALAKDMHEALKLATPTILLDGEWHLPYVESVRGEDGKLKYFNEQGNEITLDQARVLSASCCAQVSYRKLDSSLDKAEDIYSKLIESVPVHASPVEHQATPINFAQVTKETKGITHMDKNGMLWGGKLRGWVCFRHLLDNESVPGFDIDLSDKPGYN